MRANVAVVILTLNEEHNIAGALGSVCDWAREIYIVDSFSTDRTVEIASSFGCSVVQHAFENYSLQRNWALDQLPIQAEWILFLDADEWLPCPLKSEISEMVAAQPPEDGFYLKWRFIWMGHWIRRGYYPTWVLRLFRRGKAQCEQRPVNEHVLVQGSVGFLKEHFIHEDLRGLSRWIDKHNRYAVLEARELFRQRNEGQIAATLRGTQAERKRWLRYRIYNRLPPLVRPFLYFFYRVVIRLGFLDGRQAVIYHFLHALWYPLLVDLFYLEMRTNASGPRNVERATQAHFESLAHSWSEHYSASGNLFSRLRRFLNALSDVCSAPADVLDFGCGSGHIAIACSEAGYRVHGVDISPKMIESARKGGVEGLVSFSVISHTGPLQLPFANASFDAIVASSVLEYVLRPVECFAELRRVSRLGGWMLLTVPDVSHRVRKLEHFVKPIARLGRPFLTGSAKSWQEYLSISHQRHSLAEWSRLLASSGWAVRSIQQQDSPLAMIVAQSR